MPSYEPLMFSLYHPLCRIFLFILITPFPSLLKATKRYVCKPQESNVTRERRSSFLSPFDVLNKKQEKFTAFFSILSKRR